MNAKKLSQKSLSWVAVGLAVGAVAGCRRSNPTPPPVPTMPTVPAMATMPTMPAMPTVPAMPTMPAANVPLAFSIIPGTPVWNNSTTYSVERMHDNNPSTYWCSPPSPTFPLMITMQFPAPAVVQSLLFNTTMSSYQDSAPREITVEALGPTGMPVAMANAVLNQNSMTPVAFPAPTPANQVRVTIRSNHGGNYAALTEVQVLGSGVPAPAMAAMPTAGGGIQINLGQNPIAQINNALGQANAAMASAVGQANAAMASAATAMGGTMIPWTASATQYRGQMGQTLRFICPPGGTPGSVWGSGVYTDDSSICTAAVHAGRIQFATGGPVGITIMPGMPAYTGSPANGVTTSNYGQYSGSYAIAP